MVMKKCIIHSNENRKKELFVILKNE